MSKVRTQLSQTITGEYRVIWKQGETRGGYEDFNTETQAMKFINDIIRST